MGIPVAAISAGVGVANKLFGGKKRPDIRKAIAELRAARPVGYLLPEDYRSAELTRGRLTEGVTSAAGHEGYEIGRRFGARGLRGSPSEERSRARLEQQRLLGVQRAGESSEEQLYNVKQGREAFERQKALEIFGAQVGQSARDQARAGAEDAAFWNSLNEFVPTIMGAIDRSPSGVAPGTRAAGAEPGSTFSSRGYIPEAEIGID